MSNTDRRHGLKPLARVSLFLVSYLPLFLIMIFQQIYKNADYLHFGGFNKLALITFGQKFGAALFIAIVAILSALSLYVLLSDLSERAVDSGEVYRVVEVENKNSESIAYLFTYIIPFIFQDISDLAQLIPIMTLMWVTYTIYVNSSMILINPALSFWYSLYQVELTNGGSKNTKSIVLTRERFMEEGDTLKIRAIAHKIYFGIDLGKKDE